jgi:hypothetical protein
MYPQDHPAAPPSNPASAPVPAYSSPTTVDTHIDMPKQNRGLFLVGFFLVFLLLLFLGVIVFLLR